MADFILSDKQSETLKDKGWTVKPFGYYVTLYSDDFTYPTWCEICKEAGENPAEVQELTLLAFGHKSQ
jgi:hypothetical protein